jgi:hypothetical protein
MPKYKQNYKYHIYVSNKKYILKDIDNGLGLIKPNLINDSRLVIKLNIYEGNYIIIKHLLFLIYVLGITSKNYTNQHYTYFKDNIILAIPRY